MEAKSETNKQISSFLFILWAGGAALLSYSLVYALRKPFTAATFDGMDFFGMDYKVATTIMQIFGYLISKFFAIKIVSELKREDRLKFMVCSVALAELALVFFGLLPQPFNVFARHLQFHRRTQSYRYIGQLAGGKYGGELRNG